MTRTQKEIEHEKLHSIWDLKSDAIFTDNAVFEVLIFGCMLLV